MAGHRPITGMPSSVEIFAAQTAYWRFHACGVVVEMEESGTPAPDGHVVKSASDEVSRSRDRVCQLPRICAHG